MMCLFNVISIRVINQLQYSKVFLNCDVILTISDLNQKRRSFIKQGSLVLVTELLLPNEIPYSI